MTTEPPPTENEGELTRRTMLKLTGVTAIGTGSVAGCLERTASATHGLSYGGVPWGLTGALSAPLSIVGPGEGLVAHWPFDGTDETVTDVAGGNNGVVRGTPRQGIPGVYDTTAFAFGSGSDDYVEVVDGQSLTPDELTFGGWFRTESGESGQTLLQKADARFGSRGYAVDVQTPTSLRAHVAVDSGRASVNAFGVSTHDGEWHHLVCTWDGSVLGMYLDGEVVDRDDTQSGSVVHSDRSLYIGRGDNGYTTYYPMAGAVDDVRVYDRALGADEVRSLYEGSDTSTEPEPAPSDPSSQPSPAARWQFAETTGVTIADSAGSTDGFVRGSPALDADGVFDTSGCAFDGNPDDYVEVPDSSALKPEAELTFGGWFRTESGESGQTLLQKADARFGSRGYAVDVQTPTSLRAHVAVDSGRASVNAFGVSTHDGEWHHLVCTWDGSVLGMYLDGEVVDRDDTQSGSVVHSDRSLYIGRGDNGYTTYYPMAGAVDDVRVYDRALTERQIAAVIEGTTSEEPTPTPSDDSTPTNDEFGEGGYGSYGYGGVDGN
jgi:hypothetical protein